MLEEKGENSPENKETEKTWKDVENINPVDIDSSKFPGDLLGCCEYEWISQKLLQLCQEKESWEFHLDDLVEYCDLGNEPYLTRRFEEFKKRFIEEVPEEGIKRMSPLLIYKYKEKYSKII